MENTAPTTTDDVMDQRLEEMREMLNKFIPDMQELGLTANPETFPEIGAMELRGKKKNPKEKITIETEWWGIDIKMNNTLTKKIEDGLSSASTLAPAVTGALAAAGVVTGGVATIIGGAIAAAFILKTAQIKITNNGKGVHWPITHVQWAAILAAVPTGPGGITGAMMVWLHPVRN